MREVLPGIEPFWIETYCGVATTGESVHVENYAEPLRRWYEVTAFRTQAGQLAVTFTDITERKRAERTLRSLTACNDALVRASDEPGLLQRICDLVVNVGGYRMAWIGYAENDERRTVRPVAQSGFEAGYLETANITWADEDRGRGPTGTAIRTGKPVACRDTASDPIFSHWRESAMKRGYRSILALPLKNREQVIGAMLICAAEAEAFDASEQRLLEDLSHNLSFGITALRAKAESKLAAEARERLAAIVDWSNDAIISTTLDGTIVAWNRGAEKIFGYTAAEAVGKAMLLLFPPDRINEEFDILARIRKGESVGHFETVRIRKDGKGIDVSPTVSPIRDGSGAIVGTSRIIQDISARKQAEEIRERLAAIVDSSEDAIISKDLNGIITSWNRGAEKIFGYLAAEMVGKKMPTFLPAECGTEEDDILGAHPARRERGTFRNRSTAQRWQ